MKFETQVADFQSLLNKIMPAIPTKTQVEAFEHILLRLNGENLVAIASDFEINIKSTINVTNIEDGEILIPAKKVNDVIKVLDSASDVVFDAPADSSEVKITSNKSKFVVKGLEAENYIELPTLLESEAPDVENLSAFQAFFRKTEIQRLAEKTHFAVSNEEYRLNMSGVLFQFRENYVNAVSTDSYRLVRSTNFSGEKQYPKDIDIIVPVRTIEIMRKAGDDLVMTIDGDNEKYSYLRLDFGNTVVITRLIDANFPKYEAIIPVISNAEAVLDISELLKALKLVTPIVSGEKTKKCKLTFTSDELIVSSENDALGETASCNLPVEFKDTSNDNKFAEGYVASFNIGYLEEMLQNITQNDTSENLVLFYFISPEKAALIKPKSEQDLLTMILMPIRV